MPKAAIKFGFREVDKGWNALRQSMKSLEQNKSYVKIGVLDDGKGAEIRDGGLSNAEIAAIHEFGSADGRIPERSFVRSTWEAKESEYLAMMKKLVRGVYEGKMSVEKALNVAGARIANDIKNRVTQGPGIPPPLAASTIARKGSSRPLIDTGRMINSLAWKVVLSSLGGR